ncbi:hypothetical protein RSW31_24920, partial [Escherichia coli]|uniref:hypothetical protein n=1 Tax=Escherichia coli TaxID=562 RepID=UPI0028E00A3A
MLKVARFAATSSTRERKAVLAAFKLLEAAVLGRRASFDTALFPSRMLRFCTEKTTRGRNTS